MRTAVAIVPCRLASHTGLQVRLLVSEAGANVFSGIGSQLRISWPRSITGDAHSNSRRPRTDDNPTPLARHAVHASQPAIRRPRYCHVGSISPSISSKKTVEPDGVLKVHE